VRCAVIGKPIAHSLSPDLHRAAYHFLELDWQYDRFEVGRYEVAHFVAGLDRTWRGLSVTMPCKPAIVALGRPDPMVRALGVGNTVIFDGEPGDPATTRIHNTDVPGIQSVLQTPDVDLSAGVTILGNGATARACVYALAGMRVPVVSVRARSVEKTTRLAADAADWGIEVREAEGPTGAVISTVPPEVAESWTGELGRPRFVFDVLYEPWRTPLIQWAEEMGAQTATGLDLLVYQAVGQVALMTGKPVPPAILRWAAEQAIARRVG